jgi:hypothetical protein
MNKMPDFETNDWHYLQGQIFALEHLLEVANDNV